MCCSVLRKQTKLTNMLDDCHSSTLDSITQIVVHGCLIGNKDVNDELTLSVSENSTLTIHTEHFSFPFVVFERRPDFTAVAAVQKNREPDFV